MTDVITPNRKPKKPATKGKWIKYYQKLNRPTLRWVAAGLLPYGFLSSDVSEAKFSAFLIFLGAIYGIRGIENKIIDVMDRADRNQQYDKRDESPVDYYRYSRPSPTSYHTVQSSNRQQYDSQSGRTTAYMEQD